jgi:hypothetical protein
MRKASFLPTVRIALFVISFSASLGQVDAIAAQAAEATVPPQLNVPGFASCLREPMGGRIPDFRALSVAHGLGATDGLLLYLSVYPGVRPAGRAGWLVQQAAHRIWQTALESAEERLLSLLLDAADQAEFHGDSGGVLTPGVLFDFALDACRVAGPRSTVLSGDPLCAAVISHNVLRTLGRHHRAVGIDPWSGKSVDLNPGWFGRDRTRWLFDIPRIQVALIPLRADGQGDRYGEWYHFFGILAFGLRDQAVHGDLVQTWLAVRMNQVLNPILAGGAEEPEKARLDRDSAHVVAAFVRGPVGGAGGGCDSDPTSYVASEFRRLP